MFLLERGPVAWHAELFETKALVVGRAGELSFLGYL